MAGVPFLTSSYFVGELIIPNLTTATSAGTANIAELQWYIDTYEREFLKYLLGTDLYDEFIAGIAVTPTPLAKWTALKNKIYIITTGTNATYLSPAAGYVYFFYRKSKLTQTTNGKEVSALHENAEGASSNVKLTRAWNQMVKDCEVIWDWLDENSATYDTYSDEFHDYLETTNQWGI